MNPAWIAVDIAGLAAFAGFIAWVITLTFQAGKHSTRMSTLETDLNDLKTTVHGHTKSISTWEHMTAVLEEVRKDVKTLMMGRRSSMD